ncbi:hypothetical protein PS2_010939 [Malus domestica]
MSFGMNYQYTLISNSSENKSTYGGSDNSNPTSSLNVKRFCFVLSREVRNHAFDLKYSSRCSPAKNCTPLFASDLARVVSLKPIECLKDAKRLRFLVEFVDSSNVWYRKPFDPNTTLIGEGSWDAEKNQLSCAACRFLDAAGSWNNTRVGDCSTRITLRFPAVWTIRKTSSMAREIWSNKNVTKLGYFEKIMFESPQDDIGRVLIPGVKYEYTKTKQVSNSSSTTPADEFFQTFRRTLGVQPRGLTSSSKGSLRLFPWLPRGRETTLTPLWIRHCELYRPRPTDIEE